MAASIAERAGTRKRSREPRNARRRRELIDATIASIAERGLSGTTIARVAELAGLSTGIVNFYFHSKDALLLATLERVDDEYTRRQEKAAQLAGEDPVRKLEAMIDANFDSEICKPERVAVWTAFWGEARSRDDYMRVCGGREVNLEKNVVIQFEKIVAAGEHRHLDSKALGRAFYHLLSSLPEMMLADPESFDYDDAKATCRGFLSSVFPAEFAGRLALPRPSFEVQSSAPAPVTLPGWVYHDPEFYELEKEYVFRRNWLLVGHTSEAPNPGDYLTLDVAGERLFVIRDRDGNLRAFDNVCRHRASRVVRGETGSCANGIVCPYHGWRYGLDGRLRAVPAEKSFAALDKPSLGLPEIELDQWMGFIFARFSGDGPKVSQFMEPYAEEAKHYRFAELQPWGRRTAEIRDFNWKIFVENDSEGYHIPLGHPGLRRLFGSSYADGPSTEPGARSVAVLRDKESNVWSERAYQRLLPQVEDLPAELRRAWLYYGVFPSAVLQVSPDLVDCYQVLPTGPEQCRLHGFRFAHPAASRAMRAARYLNERINRKVTQEDMDFCAFADGGVRSTRYRGGVLSNLESGVREFQNRLRTLIPVALEAERPGPGQVSALNDQLRSLG